MAENWYKQILITAAEPSARSMSFNNGMKWIWPLYFKKSNNVYFQRNNKCDETHYYNAFIFFCNKCEWVVFSKLGGGGQTHRPVPIY